MFDFLYFRLGFVLSDSVEFVKKMVELSLMMTAIIAAIVFVFHQWPKYNFKMGQQ